MNAELITKAKAGDEDGFRPMEQPPDLPEPTRLGEAIWLEPYPDDDGVVWPEGRFLHGIMQLLERALPEAGVPSRRAPIRLAEIPSFAAPCLERPRCRARLRDRLAPSRDRSGPRAGGGRRV